MFCCLDQAVAEPKITKRSQVNVRNSVSLAPTPPTAKLAPLVSRAMAADAPSVSGPNAQPGDVMRKHMTRLYDELVSECLIASVLCDPLMS